MKGCGKQISGGTFATEGGRSDIYCGSQGGGFIPFCEVCTVVDSNGDAFPRQTTATPGRWREVPCSPEELPQFLAAEKRDAAAAAKRQADQGRGVSGRLEVLARQRLTLRAYLLDKESDEDWHGCSDAANDLRELDCEARTLEGK